VPGLPVPLILRREEEKEDLQTYSCNDCGRRFRNEREEKTSLEKEIWNEYVFEKQTLREFKSGIRNWKKNHS